MHIYSTMHLYHRYGRLFDIPLLERINLAVVFILRTYKADHNYPMLLVPFALLTYE